MIDERNKEDGADLWEEILADHEELDFLIEQDLARFDAAIELLAWAIFQDESGSDLRVRSNRPSARKVVENELLVWLSTRDPAIFDLAKFEVADLLELGFEDQIDSDALDDLSVRVLRQSRPNRRGVGGDHVARDVFMLVAMQIGEGLGSLGSPKSSGLANHQSEISRPNLDALNAMPPELEMARKLADKLNEHPWLKDLPEAVPTEQKIRGVWRKRERLLQRLGLTWPELDELFG